MDKKMNKKAETMEEKQTDGKQHKSRFSRLYIATAICTATVCLVIVMITAQVSRSVTRFAEKNSISLPTPVPVDSLLKDLPKEIGAVPPAIETPTPADRQQEVPEELETAANEDSAEVGLFQKKEPLRLIPPVSGEVLNPFSENRLQKSKTLGDWRTHNGIDWTADIGTPVNAAADGTIFSSEFDPMTGYTVVIAHDEEHQTVYANLASIEMAEQGREIRAGECIGAVGDSAVFEKLENSHLHFELKVNGAYQNPMDYME